MADLALTPLARAWARGAVSKEIAKLAGVHESVLDEAAALLRQVKSPGHESEYIHLQYKLPFVLAERVRGMAEKLGWTRADLFRSFFHYAMQTDREPSRRPHARNLSTTPDCEAFRETFKPKKPKVYEGREPVQSKLSVRVRHALERVVKLRATAYGVRTTTYVRLWLTDLVDGLLSDMIFDLVSTEQTFEKISDYHHPVLKMGP